MNEQYWLCLTKKINDLANQDNIDGFVVTHGDFDQMHQF